MDVLEFQPSLPLVPVVLLLESPDEPLTTKIPPLTPEVVPSELLDDQPEDPLVPLDWEVPLVAPLDQLPPLETLEFTPLDTEEFVPFVVVTELELLTPLVWEVPCVTLWLPFTPLVTELLTDRDADCECDRLTLCDCVKLFDTPSVVESLTELE